MNLPLGGDNAFFLELYGRYRRDSASVPADWGLYFEAIGDAPPQHDPALARLAADLIDAYRTHGHREAALDPLGLSPRRAVPALDRLRAAARGPTGETDFRLGGRTHRGTPRDLVATLRHVHAGSAALEASHVEDEDARIWLYEAFESALLSPTEPALLHRALQTITLADEFENFVRTKFPTKKRFGIEGSESSAVCLRELLLQACAASFEEVFIGGMHRGRLSTLATVLEKPAAMLLAQIKGRDLTEGGASFTGDVPYHLGHTADIRFGERSLRVHVSPHPSHLIVVAPVVTGLVRARRSGGDAGADTTLCLLMHTDAAFAGQGLVAEMLQLGELAGYRVGGTIHLVVNNQIGFTTTPAEGRSCAYCTDVGKMTGVPILHVNGEDPVAVARVAQVALEWRRMFRRDVLIDLVCYRRNGHNELDEPRFTQPHVWSAIDERPSLRTTFGAAVRASDESVAERVANEAAASRARLEADYKTIDSFRPNRRSSIQEGWQAIARAGADDLEDALLAPVRTGVDRERLLAIGRAVSTLAPGHSPHPKVAQFYASRLEAIETGRGINFATAEALAFATLLDEGVSVRLSGQDCVRGTFTQRHLAVHDTTSPAVIVPMEAASRDGALFEAINSPLSEYGVLAFEYGHSLADPRRLVLWEAQFGDFLNGAQVVVDQFIVSAEAKWGLMSGLVLLLPHGLEGQGPDHSSARIERILQSCAGGNMIVANPTTPANLFHLLRRQILASWRKPLFVASPKSLLRLKACSSSLDEMVGETSFRPVLVDPARDFPAVSRVVLCSGKIHYDLLHARGSDESVAIVRLEQLYPFPAAALDAALSRFAGAAEWIWCQEEPENQGAWLFVRDQLLRRGFACASKMRCVARPALPVTAGGSIERHDLEQAQIVRAALGGADGRRSDRL